MPSHQLVRLHVWVKGTQRSTRLDSDESSEFTIPCWIPNPELELQSVSDFISHIVYDAPTQTGDLVEGLLVETAEVCDPNYGGDGTELEWHFGENIYQKAVQDLAYHEDAPISADAATKARWVQQNFPHWFGWGNADPADVIDLIESALDV